LECGGKPPLWIFGVRRPGAALDFLWIAFGNPKKKAKAAASRRTP
jgi:hypothetical protein